MVRKAEFIGHILKVMELVVMENALLGLNGLKAHI